MSISEQTLAESRELAGRYPKARSGIVPMLHLMQAEVGLGNSEVIEACA